MVSFSALRVALLFGLLYTAGCASRLPEPPNLGLLKARIRAYHDSGEYLREIAQVAGQAGAWVEARAARRGAGERLAVVFDLDETLFTNWAQLSAGDFGYIAPAWNAWVDEAKAPAIEPVRAVYLAARRLGVEVLLITGRPESDRAATERNLRAIGCGDYAALVCKPGADGTVGAFKAAARRRLVAEGYVIVANLGDQDSDLAGGFAEQTFKLPDPFYLTN